nr:hypothetical protein [Tanacetum cinerariifolium]
KPGNPVSARLCGPDAAAPNRQRRGHIRHAAALARSAYCSAFTAHLCRECV